MLSSDVSRETGKDFFPRFVFCVYFDKTSYVSRKSRDCFEPHGGDRNPLMSKCVKVATRLDSGKGTRRDIEVSDKVGRYFFEQKGAEISGKARK